MTRAYLALLAIALLALPACLSSDPAYEPHFAAISSGGTYPEIVPLEDALPPPATGQLTEADTFTTTARIERLRQRAQALNAPVIDRKRRRRLREAIANHSD